MKIAFILKGLIKNKKNLRKEINSFFQDAVIYETAYANHASELASNAVKNNYTHVIAVGGDGTLNEVINGILESGSEILPLIGVLSYGTANDFTKTVKLAGSLQEIKSLIEKKSERIIDAGKVSYTDREGKQAERFFINIGDIGIGGYIVENINNSSKFLGADLTFFTETVKAMFTYKRTRVRCECDGFSWEGKTLSMVMANAKYFGSGLCIAPEASLQDGLLNLVILGDVTIADYLKNINRIKRGEKINHPEVHYNTCREIYIIPLEGKCPIDLDGEFIGYAPARFRIVPAKIRFLME